MCILIMYCYEVEQIIPISLKVFHACMITRDNAVRDVWKIMKMKDILLSILSPHWNEKEN